MCNVCVCVCLQSCEKKLDTIKNTLLCAKLTVGTLTIHINDSFERNSNLITVWM